ncbi:hypothetical protein GCM10012275_33450 [Longimycelium tulufanense]|uniref:YbaB/EbfC DNA-binding family protein n=1 Tax=Longimycelium tulufanense TaxID=907463 RepID=A0A8J3CCM9_9PSEU|nr:YbaB/EbfC family nucleoid-associated protein [Longimycelium tulufanense]GGM59633.1 hypothetical protein GCM10012275_33450 [Longimycelium tulufanense]
MNEAGPSSDDLIAAAEERRRASERLTQTLDKITGTAKSPDGSVVATATARGELCGLHLEPAALRLGPQRLGELVAQTAQQAARDALQRCYNALAPVLGDHMTLLVEQLAGPAPARVDGWDVASTMRPPLVAGRGRPRPAQEETGPHAVAEETGVFNPATLPSDR